MSAWPLVQLYTHLSTFVRSLSFVAQKASYWYAVKDILDVFLFVATYFFLFVVFFDT